MTRYCFGPTCREMVPLTGRSPYCDACWWEVKRRIWRECNARYRARHRERYRKTALRWYCANRERDNARRREYERRRRAA